MFGKLHSEEVYSLLTLALTLDFLNLCKRLFCLIQSDSWVAFWCLTVTVLGGSKQKAPCLPGKWIPDSAETLLSKEGKQRKLQTESICVCFPVYLGTWTVLQGGVSWSLRHSYLLHRPVGHVDLLSSIFLPRWTSSTYLVKELVLEICSIGTGGANGELGHHSSKSPLLLQILE